MSRVARVVLVVLSIVLVSGTAVAQQEGKHLVHVGINPFGVIWGQYKVDVGVPITGFVEAAGQINHFRGRQFANLVGSETPEDWPSTTSLGAVVRIFPGQNAAGFFLAGRLMYLNVNPADPALDSVNDATAGIDLGWRWKWPLMDRFGMFFQTYFGIQRWVFSGDLQTLFGSFNLPFWPSAGLHFDLDL